MEPKIVTKPAFQIIGIQFRGNNDNNECPKLWDAFSKRVQEVKPMTTNPIIAYGVCSNCDLRKNIFTYTAGLEVKDVSSIPSDMIAMDIPKQEYALFESTLPTLISTLQEIHKQWLPHSDFYKSDGPEFELYDADFDPEKPDSKMFLYIPIIRK